MEAEPALVLALARKLLTQLLVLLRVLTNQ